MSFWRWINENFNLFQIIRTLRIMESEDLKFPPEIKKASTEDLRFMLREVEDRNRSLNERADSLYEKSIIFFGISITALSGLVVYISDNPPNWSAKYIICVEIIILLIMVCCRLKRNLKMAEYHATGVVPKVFTLESFYKKSKKSLEWEFTKQMILDHQQRIDNNIQLNKDRAGRIKDAIEYLFYIPAVSIITWIILYIIAQFCS